jgi:DUF2892 family protein
MTQNMGSTDRVLRIVAALVVAALYVTGTIAGLAAIVLGIVALVFVVTAAVGFCPAYVPLGISTRKAPVDSVHV